MNDQQPDSVALWAAVDRLTQPSTRRLFRAGDPDVVEALAADLRRQETARLAAAARPKVRNPVIVAGVSQHQLASYARATKGHATVPSLWDQAVDALTASSSDKAEGSSGSVHRTPLDVTLMEQMADMREAMAVNLGQRKLKPRDTVPAQMRQLAAHVAGHEPQHIAWWTFRFEQWARVLAVYLQAVQQQPKPRRIRGVACPECQVRSVVVEDATGQPVRVPPIVIDFHEGYIRAAECTGCGATLAWRGEQMWELADRLQQQEPA